MNNPATDRPPEPGQPGYMAWIADLSHQLGTLSRAFAYAYWNTSSRNGL